MSPKINLRAEMKELRQSMADSEVTAKSQIIAEKHLSSVNWPAVKRLHIYQSVPAWKEVDTAPLLRRIRAEYPQIEVTIAPTNKAAPPQEKFDLIVVPVLGFDKDNYRLGMGGGWYDRFLAAQPQALKIGLGFENGFIAAGLPREPHDIPLDRIITEV